MKLEYTVTDKTGKQIKLWASGPATVAVDPDKYLGIRDVIINTLDMSLEPYTYEPTGKFKHESEVLEPN